MDRVYGWVVGVFAGGFTFVGVLRSVARVARAGVRAGLRLDSGQVEMGIDGKSIDGLLSVVSGVQGSGVAPIDQA